MKKIFVILLFVLSLTLASCNTDNEWDKLGISKKLYTQMVESLDDSGFRYDDNKPILEIVSRYDDTYIINISLVHNQEYIHNNYYGYYKKIDDLVLQDNGFNYKTLVFNDGKVSDIDEAYTLNILTMKQVEDLFEHICGYAYSEINLQYITPQTIYNIWKIYYQENDITISNEKIYNFSVCLYVNSYMYSYPDSDFIFLPVLVDEEINQKEYNTEVVKDYSFEIFKGFKLIIYQNGKIYSLQDAYDSKIINDEQLKMLYFHNSNKYYKYLVSEEVKNYA
ncbi:MAG: hypothetical protein IJX78_07625 [Bacilli bacterium]|nr:hypothetical protein [Bacilli bacterium]